MRTIDPFLENVLLSSFKMHSFARSFADNLFYSNIKGRWDNIFVGVASSATITDESSNRLG